MGLRSLLHRLFGEDRTIRALSQDAARRCEVAVWQRVGERASTMPLAEARGYVRARSSAIVHNQVELLLMGQTPATIASRAQIVELALETAVIRAVEVLRTRTAQAVPVRRAA